MIHNTYCMFVLLVFLEQSWVYFCIVSMFWVLKTLPINVFTVLGFLNVCLNIPLLFFLLTCVVNKLYILHLSTFFCAHFFFECGTHRSTWFRKICYRFGLLIAMIPDPLKHNCHSRNRNCVHVCKNTDVVLSMNRL